MMHSHDQDPSAVTKANAESQPGLNPIIGRGNSDRRQRVPSSSLPKFNLLKSGLEKEVKKMAIFVFLPIILSCNFQNNSEITKC